MIQHVSQPTRHRQNQISNCLDLILTNDDDSVQKLSYTDPLGLSDHLIIEMEYNVELNIVHNHEPTCERFSYDYGDYAALREKLKQIDWNKEFSEMSTDAMMSHFESKLSDVMEQCIPKHRVNPRNFDKRQPFWMNNHALRSLKKKHNAYKRWVLTKCGKDYQRYKKQSNNAKATIRKLVRKFEQNIAMKIKSNSKEYWKYANSKLKNKSKVPDLKTSNNEFTKSEQEKVDVLNHFFTSVFTREDLSSIPQITDRSFASPLTEIDISHSLVLDAMKSLNASKSPGPDGIHPRVLKEAAEQIAFPLHLIFKSSLETGEIPEKWKLANVTPIFKKGCKSMKQNYRPISLTSLICRLLEKIMKNKIVKHLEENDLFSPDQYGFRKKRSCVTQLLEVLEKWTTLLDHGSSIDVIYFDFAKAFDSVPHQRLISKLQAYGIKGNVLKWIIEYLSDRKQRVILNGYKSPWSNVLSGVPQGSVLGPLLFLIYINDIPECVNTSHVKIFADDLKLYSENNKDSKLLQSDITNIERWSAKWQLPLNSGKCFKMQIGSTSQKSSFHLFDKKDDRDIDIIEVEETKDLGVIIDTKLKFEKQVAACVKKANGVLTSIKRTINYIRADIFKTLCETLVRPLLESGGANMESIRS